jgi:hypothetical protein
VLLYLSLDCYVWYTLQKRVLKSNYNSKIRILSESSS